MAHGGFDRAEWAEEPSLDTAGGPLGCLLGFLVPLLGLVLMALGVGLVRSVRWPDGGQPARAMAGEEITTVSVGSLAPLFTPEVQYWAPQIRQWSEAYGLDPNLIATVMQIESCGDPQATSGAGARGLFQVMPYHFRPGEDPYHPDTNALRGLGYLRQALQQAQGDVERALAMYNGGPAVLSWPRAYWPAETQRYVFWGSGIYADARAGKSESPTLARWLAAGGASLCRRAHQRLGLP